MSFTTTSLHSHDLHYNYQLFKLIPSFRLPNNGKDHVRTIKVCYTWLLLDSVYAEMSVYNITE